LIGRGNARTTKEYLNKEGAEKQIVSLMTEEGEIFLNLCLRKEHQTAQFQTYGTRINRPPPEEEEEI